MTDALKEVVRRKYGEAAKRAAARQKGPCCAVHYGPDLTDEMLALARDNQAKADVTDAAFLAGEDVVVRGEVPPQVRRGVEMWAGCVAGALAESDYVARRPQR